MKCLRLWCWAIIWSFQCVFGQSLDRIDPIVYVLDARTLNELENSGYSLAETLGHSTSISQTKNLYHKVSAYRDFADTLGRPVPHDPKTDQLPEEIPLGYGDVPNMVQLIRGFEDKGARSSRDQKGGFFIRHLSNNSWYPYQIEYDGDEPRHFDPRWLYSKYAFMKLVAVVNRIDRMDFRNDSCGEIRFVYRLSYQSSTSRSSLPFLINVVHQYPKKESCRDYAKAWMMKTPSASHLKDGPLKDLQFLQMEVNFQSLRFTSGYMHDFGGQAMYIQRIFRQTPSGLAPIPLENTPDVLTIEKHPELLDHFVTYLAKKDHLEALDQGTLNIQFDPKFLSKMSVSWSTLGRSRLANKPYARLFRSKMALIQSIDLSKLNYIKSHRALIERLDNLTCMGCHQSGGTAGFHILGYADSNFSHPFNRQQLALSPHAMAEESRRKAYIKAIALGQSPNKFRPHSIFSNSDWQKAKGIPMFEPLDVGQLCMASEQDFVNTPKCKIDSNRPTQCWRTVTNAQHDVLIGECVLKKAVEASGSACWEGEITENDHMPSDRGEIPTYNFFAFQDKWKLKGAILKNRDPYSCVLPQSGAPLGRMSRRCTLKEEKLDIAIEPIPHEICANQGGAGFDLCAASGDSGACLESKVARAMLDTCHSGRACREDYICQKFPNYSKIFE
ncbi:MAG: hypothetical protein KDD48_08405, partial [Bdellovibrionales bacterium]|nr:hypothetical protein [Bdellovibrionales bacterium]